MADCSESGRDPQAFLDWLDGYLAQYAEQVRHVLHFQQQRVANSADIVVDGLQ